MADLPAPGRRWRLVVHALDRTGPPVLARTFVRWLGAARPHDRVEVLAFRGGPLAGELAPASVTVVLDDEEPWDAAHPEPRRAAVLRERLGTLGEADGTLLVSVSAGQVLPLVGDLGPTATWVVEVGDDLHWVRDLPDLVERTDRWLAGSEATRCELGALLGASAVPALVPEFVGAHESAPPGEVADARRRLGADDDDVLVVGAGIGTPRKGMDLFVEIALGAHRAGRSRLRFAWIGGERDPLHPRVAEEVAELGLETVVLHPSVPDLGPWLEAADVLLHPARADAFPLVALHAVLAGTPVVGFRGVGGLPELLGPGFAGVGYPDVAGLASVVAELEGPEERVRLLAAQQQWVRDRFVVEVAAPELLRHLEELAG